MILGRRNKLLSRFCGITAFAAGFAFFRHEVNKSKSKISEAKVLTSSKLMTFVDETHVVVQEASLVMETESDLSAISADDSSESAETDTQEITPYESSYSVPSFSGYGGADFYYGDFLFEEALYLNYGEEEDALVLANVFSSLLPSAPNFIYENRDDEEVVSITPDVVIAVPSPNSPLDEEEDTGDIVSVAPGIEEPSPDSPLVEDDGVGDIGSATPDIEEPPLPDSPEDENDDTDEIVSTEPDTETDDDDYDLSTPAQPQPMEDRCDIPTVHCVFEYTTESFHPSSYSDSITDIHVEMMAVLTISLRGSMAEFSNYDYSGEGTIRFTYRGFKVSDIDFSKISPSLRLENTKGAVITPPEPMESYMESYSDMSYDSLYDFASMYAGMEDLYYDY